MRLVEPATTNTLRPHRWPTSCPDYDFIDGTVTLVDQPEAQRITGIRLPLKKQVASVVTDDLRAVTDVITVRFAPNAIRQHEVARRVVTESAWESTFIASRHRSREQSGYRAYRHHHDPHRRTSLTFTRMMKGEITKGESVIRCHTTGGQVRIGLCRTS